MSNNVSRRQASRWAEQNPQRGSRRGNRRGGRAAPQADPIAQLKELAELRDTGVLTEDEFADQKAKLLAS